MIIKWIMQFFVAGGFIPFFFFPTTTSHWEGYLLQEIITALPAASFPVALDREDGPKKIREESLGVVVSAKSAVLIDSASRKILFEKEAEVPRSIGSITKLMTALVILENDPDLEMSIQILPSDRQIGGKDTFPMYETVKLRDLLFASLVGSDNTATMALARSLGKSLPVFIEQMNEKAKQIGMIQTHFADPTGLSTQNQASAIDLAFLFDEALKHSLIEQDTQTDKVTVTGQSGRTYMIESTNDLLSGFLNKAPYQIKGGKTGYLPAAGYSLGVQVQKDAEKNIFAIVLGADSLKHRFEDIEAMSVWAYETYEWSVL